MFVWTIGDVVGIIGTVAIVLIVMFVSISEWMRQARCKHDAGVNETQACDAICRKCLKNLGFIGTWREKQGSYTRRGRSEY